MMRLVLVVFVAVDSQALMRCRLCSSARRSGAALIGPWQQYRHFMRPKGGLASGRDRQPGTDDKFESAPSADLQAAVADDDYVTQCAVHEAAHGPAKPFRPPPPSDVPLATRIEVKPSPGKAKIRPEDVPEGYRLCFVCGTVENTAHWRYHVLTKEHRHCELRAKLIDDWSNPAAPPPPRYDPLPHDVVWCGVCNCRVTLDLYQLRWKSHLSSKDHQQRRRIKETMGAAAKPLDF